MVRTILTVIYFIIALVVVILAMVQSKEDEGLSSTLTGSSTSNFYEKNKTLFVLSVLFSSAPCKCGRNCTELAELPDKSAKSIKI